VAQDDATSTKDHPRRLKGERQRVPELGRTTSSDLPDRVPDSADGTLCGAGHEPKSAIASGP
jgi:hypothetical protein